VYVRAHEEYTDRRLMTDGTRQTGVAVTVHASAMDVPLPMSVPTDDKD
jgi:hypothetical protein